MIQAAVLGADVSKSRSPVIHEAAFRALKMKGRYQALSVEAAGFEALIAKLRRDGFRYVNVTIPHKGAAAALATSASPAVKAAGAANTLIFDRGRIRAENTDGVGLIAALGDLGASPGARRVAVIVGAGGAAAGAAQALTQKGTQVRLVARNPAAARKIKARLPAARAQRVTVAAWNPRGLAAALDGAHMLISAVPAAAWHDNGANGGLEALDRDTAVLEMAYGTSSALAAAVRGRAARYADGLGMLVHQAAHAITLALGTKPPLAPMFRAAREPSST
ncbi:MAG TPA: saccharopine dehydrogenase NADP-binding domain-containing protein [Polyangia bacterium]|nr:saccharopine dehydrogenase NADP-binding domain-containing protein [Polyangia bacterium]